MKVPGLVIGLGPETGAVTYLRINELVARETTQRPRMIMANVPVDLDREQAFINGKNEHEYYLKLIKEEVATLEKSGVDFIVIPCNSVHSFIDILRKETCVPILSIVEETVNFLIRQGVTHIGLLATSATINEGMYFQKLTEAGISFIAPEPIEQIELNERVVRVINNRSTVEDVEIINNIVASLAIKGVQAIVFACTDLQLLKPDSVVPLYDTMEILIQRTVQEILRE